uniref:DUF1279 domain-containing protein n=1 Tax=Nelumbo nucifera TaxID=4432 RepID=A0A822Y4Q1_NELNU|nr:TPA_asm: hypothetical protein HUJ06_030382 [Nelumbo nucifera]
MATSLLFPPVSSGTVFCSSSTCFSKSEKFSLSSLSASQLLCKSHRRHHLKVRALKETTKEPNTSPPPSAEEITEKFGLEVGLWKIFSSKEGGKEGKGEKSKGDQAKELLAKYGGAYLATSITLSLISFSLCYVLISAGIDVQALLQKVSHLETLILLLSTTHLVGVYNSISQGSEAMALCFLLCNAVPFALVCKNHGSTKYK